MGLKEFQRKVLEVMSALSDKIAELKSTVASETQQVLDEVTALKAKITELEALVAAGGATPEDMAELEALKVAIAAINPNDPTTIETARAAAAKKPQRR